MRAKAIILGAVFIGMLAGVALAAPQTDMPAEEAASVGRTPPRLSFLDGEVSFWRPGADDWTQAEVNTALAPGDQLYIRGVGNLELQVGAQAFVRGGKDAQIGLVTQEPDFLQFKVTRGRASFDLRSLGPGRTVEVDTPHAAFTIDHTGYYRMEVEEARTTFIVRRAGQATAVAAGGEAVPVEAGEAVVIQGPTEQSIAINTAPEMDAWDNWNYERTDYLLAAGSSRYVSPEMYGTGDLDRYGSWRTLPEYGPVWIPSGVGPGWAPYSTGSWMYDPYYGWTWVDTAPWGWAPYHYGRWVYVNSYWCWAPGPLVATPYYAPALVAFFGGPSVSIGISIGGPGVGWVALGWGEPLIPWWGRPGFIHRPWWGGWGGPRCINNTVIHHRTIVTVNDIHVYRNSRVRHALVVVDKAHFGHGRIGRDHRRFADAKGWRPIRRAPDIRPSAKSYAPSNRRGIRPSQKSLKRAVVTYKRHDRVRAISIKEPRKGYRPEVRSVQENRRQNSRDRSDFRKSAGNFKSESIKPPPVRVHKAPKAVRGNMLEKPGRGTEKVPAVNRSTVTNQNRTAFQPGPGAASVHRPARGTRSGTITSRGHRSYPSEAPAATRRSQPRRRPQVEATPPGPPAAIRRNSRGGGRSSSRPEMRAPAVRMPDRPASPPEAVGPARNVQNPGAGRRYERSRQSSPVEQDVPNSGNSRQWRQPEGRGRPEMNRGGGSKSRGGFRRGFRD